MFIWILLSSINSITSMLVITIFDKLSTTFRVCRSFTARPIFSTDDPNVDKHKLERFLHDKRQCVATIYGPIQYPPLPLLAFKVSPDQPPQLVLSGESQQTHSKCKQG